MPVRGGHQHRFPSGLSATRDWTVAFRKPAFYVPVARRCKQFVYPFIRCSILSASRMCSHRAGDPSRTETARAVLLAIAPLRHRRKRLLLTHPLTSPSDRPRPLLVPVPPCPQSIHLCRNLPRNASQPIPRLSLLIAPAVYYLDSPSTQRKAL